MLVAYACGTLFVLCTYKLQANWNMDFRGGYIELRWQLKSPLPPPFTVIHTCDQQPPGH